MIVKYFALLGFFVTKTAPIAEAAMGDDYITELPPTVYESDTMSPQNMDFDKANNMFVAHSGWYNDKLVHYYKFRMYTPKTYADVIKPESTFQDVPIQKLYIVTTDGGLGGAVGDPIIEYHTSDGTDYSDFMELVFVEAPDEYDASSPYKSKGDVSGAKMNETGFILNIPVVPTDSTLQDPDKKGTSKAPIDPVPVWYRGQQVHTYVFEVTDQSLAEHFASTRTDDPTVQDYKIYVKPYANKNFVTAIPLWHVNQFSNGVTEGENGGGPSPQGMRNIIDLDREDAGYSPLWHIQWVTKLPINYKADDASNIATMTIDNGFDKFSSPMFVNCPDIGAIGASNALGKSYQTKIDPTKSNLIQGSHKTLIMTPDKEISIEAPLGESIATTKTNMMGAYEISLTPDLIPEGTKEIFVVSDGKEIDTFSVMEVDTSGAISIGIWGVQLLGTIILLALLA
mmetsp:Transcript_36461/g.74407  ORF Transcript_36461/g.74407 Transcript_36461/m.74407 type:complete len:454 (-) Transcript_36461:313-1674(-)|eukprot:CAMPEP_0183291460 /NCGR_PEP_ID=MMETSP0160_2-20130417/879_1 /TAXON_ID=2839 ORGANISM="Odontella Sinensis, Strain Grunow 1884" /NCGR_SAMPLE_ID=MMETSP0160_2 /ASSEMBLY_ACC=CAM_ASM_000250 /LENGTH=453 /DNA_ID=CAMNT_0025452273 /DNA_START=18 /DNA_END=1379 /DNA_ORIENTATION=-